MSHERHSIGQLISMNLFLLSRNILHLLGNLWFKKCLQVFENAIYSYLKLNIVRTTLHVQAETRLTQIDHIQKDLRWTSETMSWMFTGRMLQPRRKRKNWRWKLTAQQCIHISTVVCRLLLSSAFRHNTAGPSSDQKPPVNPLVVAWDK